MPNLSNDVILNEMIGILRSRLENEKMNDAVACRHDEETDELELKINYFAQGFGHTCPTEWSEYYRQARINLIRQEQPDEYQQYLKLKAKFD